MRHSIRLITLGLLLVGVSAASCANSDNPPPSANDGAEPTTWSCAESQDGTSCSCDLLRPGVMSVGFDQVSSCGGYSCCLLSDHMTDATLKSCECFDVSDCAAEAATRVGTSVVALCPLDAAAPACAAEGENCRPDYLAQNELAGCCSGTLCRANASGTPVCQAASADEIALAAQCMKTAKSSQHEALTVSQGNIVTSAGSLTFSTVQRATLGVGPGGCLNKIEMTFAGSTTCSLEISAAVTNGTWAVTGVSGTLNGCSGFTGMALDGFLLDQDGSGVGASFQGTSCSADGSATSYCYSGHFDWRLNGQVGTLTVNDQHLVADGIVCSATAAGDCPTQ